MDTLQPFDLRSFGARDFRLAVSLVAFRCFGEGGFGEGGHSTAESVEGGIVLVLGGGWGRAAALLLWGIVVGFFGLGPAGSALGQAPGREVPGTPAESDPTTVKTAEYQSYNVKGQVTKQLNALGKPITKEYQGPGGRLSKVEMQGGDLSVEYSYNDRGLLSEITNEAGNTKAFTYDGLGRLEAAKNDAGQVVTEHDYQYTSGDPSSDPNYVETVQKGGQSPDVVSRKVVDGLGRPWQEVTETGGGNRLTQVTTYDPLGREARTYRPFEDTDGGLFDADADYESEPRTKTTYEANPLNRPSGVDPPEPDGDKIQKSYGVEQNPFRADTVLSGYASYQFRYVQTTDESGDVSRVYKDGFGRKVIRASGYGTSDEAVTYFQYDAVGNLTKTVRPEGDSVTYAYDRRDQQIRRSSPDGGASRTRYDAAGNPRFTQNAVQGKRGTARYTCLGAAGRRIESGVAPLSVFGADAFRELDPGALASGEGSAGGCLVPGQWSRTVRAYDQPPASGEAPWSSWPEWSDGDGSDPPLDNLKGQVAARAHRAKNSVVTVGGGGTLEGPTLRAATDRVVAGSTTVAGEVTFTAGSEVRLEAGFSTADGALFRAEVDPSKQSESPEWRLVFFSYDAEGNVRRKDHFVPGLGQVTLRYRRDRQGRVTRQTAKLQRSGKTFHQWYEYNERGLVERVAAGASASGSTRIVSYTYAPDGQVDTTDWEGVSGQIARRYNDRGWLTGIGDLGAPTGFAAGYDYFPDGNVETMESNAPGNSSLTYYYSYDALDRLELASNGTSLGGRYDVQGIRYDRNGNLEGLVRYGKDGETVDDLAYTYADEQGGQSPNRLASISDAVADASRHGWDAGSGSFEYDAAGRMLQAPAPTGLEAVSYNAQGLPEAMALGGAEGETTLTYRYTADGQRTYKKVEGSEATRYVRDGAVTVAVVEGGSLKHWTLTLPGGEVIGRVGSGGSSRRYYLKDHLGSIRAVLDGGGGVSETRDYYPFGLPMPGRYEEGSPPTQEDFTGYEKDEATGLHYAGARYYASAFGRFTTTDRFADKYPSLSPYQYGANNPATTIDMNGDSTVVVNEPGVLGRLFGKGTEKVLLHEGEAYWADSREKYDGRARNEDGELTGYVGEVANAKEKIRSGGKEGADLISELENSSTIVNIKEGDNEFVAKGQERTVYWDPNDTSGGIDTRGGTSRSAFVGLAHEFGHAQDALDGKMNFSTWFTMGNNRIPVNEQYATHVENLVRSENGIPLREFYGIRNGKGVGRVLINGTSKSKFFNTTY